LLPSAVNNSVTFTIYSGVLMTHIPTDINYKTTLSIHFAAETIVETVATIRETGRRVIS